jgi:two-component sensor histidine kinase
LNERRELESAKHALEAEVLQKGLLLKEVNHRIKNSLQIVSSILHLQAAHTQNEEANRALQDASARVLAIAAVHERLYTGSDIRVVTAKSGKERTEGNIGDAMVGADSVEVDISSVDAPTDMAIPLALVVNELLANAVKYGRSPYRVTLSGHDGRLVLTVSDSGLGPATDESPTGLGSHIVRTAARQLGATLKTMRRPGGYYVELNVPLHAAPNHESLDR